MRFRLSDEQQALAREARRFFERAAPPAELRRAMESDSGFAPELWAGMVELGWPALPIDEAHGGAGLGPVELGVVMEAAGAALACAPLLSTVCLAANLIRLGGDEEQQARWLPELAAGRLRAAVAWLDGERPLRARARAGGYVLDGDKRLVVDGHTAQLVLVSAGDDVLAVAADAPGLTRRARPSLDPTRRVAELSLDGVPALARLPRTGALARTLELASVALAAEQLGGAERCLALAVDYAKTRVQFGRAIGSFQAIKHTLADLLMRIESARSAVQWAAYVAGSDEDELPVAAALARSVATETYLRAAGDLIQVHGGMGFTWEHEAHLHLRRARGSAVLLGDPASQRARIATALGL
jgi:alkylation response protein AidB-like acyl-CoA dehydrogenase